jgi:hypothetical protein
MKIKIGPESMSKKEAGKRKEGSEIGRVRWVTVIESNDIRKTNRMKLCNRKDKKKWGYEYRRREGNLTTVHAEGY